MAKNSKIVQLLNYRLKITIQDGRVLIGNMLAFDKHMNVVLSECEEFRKVKPKAAGMPEKEEKRTLGLVILRGETIVSLSVEAPPPPSLEDKRGNAATGGPGVGRPAGRGMPIAPVAGAPMGLAGPVRGVGGPTIAAMAPPMGRGGVAAPPMAYPRPPPGMMPPAGAPPFAMPPPGFPGAAGRGMMMPPPGFRPPPGMPPMPPGFRPPQ